MRANITYLAGEIATKTIESVQAQQKRAAVSQKAVETKQLSPRWVESCQESGLAYVPNTTVYPHVAKKYAKFGAGRPIVSVVLGERGQKIIAPSCQ